jgi:hypothetical protein
MRDVWEKLNGPPTSWSGVLVVALLAFTVAAALGFVFGKDWTTVLWVSGGVSLGIGLIASWQFLNNGGTRRP